MLALYARFQQMQMPVHCRYLAEIQFLFSSKRPRMMANHRQEICFSTTVLKRRQKSYSYWYVRHCCDQWMYSVCQKNHPLRPAVFWHFFTNGWDLNHFFTHLLYVPIYARLQIFIQLSQILTKLCHIKRNYLVHIICSKCPPSAEMHTFRRLQKSLIALLIVVCGKSSQICCFYNVNKYAGYDMTSMVTSFAQ